MNPEKCCSPARKMEILGFLYDSVLKSCRLSEKKRKKYIARINDALSSPSISIKNLERLLGNLTYAAQVAPFGRPFLSVLSSKINPTKRKQMIRVTNEMKNAFVIQRMILTKNSGLTFRFILGNLPHAKNEQFIDASTNFGCGGVAGYRYFMIDNAQCSRSKFVGENVKFEDIKIAYRELLSAVIAFLLFAPYSPSSLVRINTDNKNVLAQLKKGRCSKKLGYRLLSVIELIKMKYNLKVSVFYIKSSANVTADALSRGEMPEWLRMRGEVYNVDIKKIDKILVDPIKFWRNSLSLQVYSKS